MSTATTKSLTLVAGQGDMGGGEHMLLRIGEAAQSLGWAIKVVGPKWGNLMEACSLREFDYVACAGNSRRSFALSAAAYLAKPKLGVVWANGALPALASTATPNPLVVHLHQHPSSAQRAAVRAAMRRARAVIVPSRYMQSVIPGSRVLLNWTEELGPRDQHVQDEQSYTIAYIGRLSVDKGVDTLADAVDAMARNATDVRIRLVVAGDYRFVPDHSAEVVRAALNACSAEVVQLGWTDPIDVLGAADVVVVPSRWEEPFGLVAAEAMAVECPLVVAKSGALPEVVGASYPWTFTPGDAHGLSDMLTRLSEGESTQTEAMRQRWEEEFSPMAGRKRFEAFLRPLDAS